MARKSDIRLRRSNVANAVPGSADLNEGELAINTADGALYFKKSDGTIITGHDNTIMHIDSTNSRVGIGNVNPGKELDVLGTVRAKDSSANQHQLRADKIISYGTDAILQAQSTGDDVRLNTTGNVTRLIATAEGKVGIGTTAPSKKLHVEDSSAYQLQLDGGNNFWNVGAGWSGYYDGSFLIANNTGDKLVIDSNGKVGIGTNSPANTLHVNSGSDNNVARFESTDGGAVITLKDNTGAAAVANIGDNLYFKTSSSQTDRMTILTNGNVGIGTTSPSHLLELSNTMASSPKHIFYRMTGTNAAGGGAGIKFDSSASNNDAALYWSGIQGIRTTSNDGSNELRFWTTSAAEAPGGTQGAPSQRMVISETGNVGIGTDSPKSLLNVRGTGADGGILTLENDSTSLVTDRKVGQIHFYSNDGSANGAGIKADIKAIAENSIGSEIGLAFGTSGTGSATAVEAMRIDASGNLLVGTTSVSNSGKITVDGGTNGNGIYAVTDASAGYAGAVIERSASDGDLIIFKKSTVKVGSIGTEGGNLTIDGNPATGKSGIEFSGAEWLPRDNGANSNGAISLGDSTNKFKDLYLSGIGYFGSTTRLYEGAGGDAFFKNTDSGADLFIQSARRVRFLASNSEAMRIESSGNVGIGTSSPAESLHTTGNIRFGDSAPAELYTNSSELRLGVDRNNDNGTSNITFYVNNSETARIDSSGNTIFGGTSAGAAGAMTVKVDGSYTDLYLYGAGTSQGGRIFFGDSSDRSSIIGTYGSGGGGKLSFKTDTTGGTSQDRLVIDSDGSITFNNAFTFPTSIGSAGQVLKVPNSGSVLVWSDQTGGGGSTDSISDSDGDTKIQVEETADEDIIRFDIAGTEQLQLNSTGLVVAGNLTVNGTQTTLNTATLDVEDLNITVAKGAANATAASGAGLTVDGANATWTYSLGDDAWASNKHAQFYTGDGTGTLSVGRTSDQAIKLYVNDNQNRIFAYQDSDENGDHYFDLVRSFGGTGRADFRILNGSSIHMLIDKDGHVGIGHNTPDYPLHIKETVTNAGAVYIEDGTSWLRVVPNLGGGGFNPIATAGDVGLIFSTDSDSSTDTSGALILAPHSNSIGGIKITETGRVGIGHAAPAQRLHVNGTVEINGNIYFDGSTTSNHTISHGTSTQQAAISFWGEDHASYPGQVHIIGRSDNAAAHSGEISFWDYTGSSWNRNMVIKKNGNVGINNDNPGYKLDVGGSVRFGGSVSLVGTLQSYSGAFTVRNIAQDQDLNLQVNDGGTNTTALTVQGTTANVGIGTTSPAFKLDVQVANGNTLARFKDSDSSHSGIVIAGDANAGWVGNDVGVTGEGIYYQSSDNLMRFYTNSTERIRIASDGKIGIGTTSPNDLLHIHATGNGSSALIIEDDARRLEMGRDMIQAKSSNGSTVQNLYIQPAGKTIFASNSGSVGIGTASPSKKLHVQFSGDNGVRIESEDNHSSLFVDSHTGYGQYIRFTENNANNYWLNADTSGRLLFRPTATGAEGNIITFDSSGQVGIGKTTVNAKLQVEELGIDTTTTSTSATTQVTLASLNITKFRSARFTIQITNTTDSTYHSTEILAIHDGTTANITEFGEVHTGSSVEATFDAAVTSGFFRLQATPTSTNNMVFKVVSYAITV